MLAWKPKAPESKQESADGGKAAKRARAEAGQAAAAVEGESTKDDVIMNKGGGKGKGKGKKSSRRTRSTQGQQPKELKTRDTNMIYLLSLTVVYFCS